MFKAKQLIILLAKRKHKEHYEVPSFISLEILATFMVNGKKCFFHYHDSICYFIAKLPSHMYDSFLGDLAYFPWYIKFRSGNCQKHCQVRLKKEMIDTEY